MLIRFIEEVRIFQNFMEYLVHVLGLYRGMVTLQKYLLNV